MSGVLRARRIIASGMSTVGARIVTVICSFVAIPICLSHLGAESFGVWSAITSVLSLLAFSDFGIGNGVLALLSGAWGRNDVIYLRRIFSTALLLLSAVSVVFLVVFFVVYPYVSWASVFGAKDGVESNDVNIAVAVLVVIFAINIPSTLFQRLQFALQMGYVNGLSQAASGVLSLVMIYGVSKTELGLPGMVAATLTAPLVTLWVSAAWLFLKIPVVRPVWKEASHTEIIGILRSGSQFFLLGVVFCLCQTSDTVIIANLLGAEEVARYAVHQKYVSPIVFIGGMALTPLWAAYAEALAKNDRSWIARAFKNSLAFVIVVSVIVSGGLLIMLEPALNFWIKGRIEPDYIMASSLLIWAGVELTGKAISTFLHGVGLVAEQVWTALFFLPLCLSAKIIFGQHYGAPGVVLGTALAYILAHAWPYWCLVRRWHADARRATLAADAI